MARDPLRVACFRFEQIAALLDARLTRGERRRLVEVAARTPVVWPSGREAPVPMSTIYRWLRLYRASPKIESLLPRPRPRSKKAPSITPEWVAFALALLEEESCRSLYVLGQKLRDRFHLSRAPSRASLHRALRREPRYSALRRRARGDRRLRTRFQAITPHEIWQADAKAKFRVHFADGTTREFKVISILDDNTRFVLRGLVVREETTAAAVAVFRQAAARFGLPHKFYADRGSAYDSDLFRKGLAILGVHRIWTRSHNAPAHGKIEAYHRALQRWFVVELKHQLVRDERHLQDLFDASIDGIYHEHVHRELRRTPSAALGNRVSDRQVSLERLRDAFLVERVLVVHRKDGTVRIDGTLFRVPGRSTARKVRVGVDPDEPHAPFLISSSGTREPLVPAVHRTNDPKPASASEEPVGSLTPLLERYRGRTLPLARPGFGLPEIYAAFSRALGRPVPSTEAEAALVVEWLATHGPFEPKAFHAVLARVLARLGSGRPLAQILRALSPRSSPSAEKELS